MAFSSCLKQVEFVNPGVQLTYKGIHPLHGVEGFRLLDYDNDPPTCVDLNDLELEAFDPMLISLSHRRPPRVEKPLQSGLLLHLLILDFCIYFCNN
jgi:hypothetical protein